jgi:hypothetical protein
MGCRYTRFHSTKSAATGRRVSDSTRMAVSEATRAVDFMADSLVHSPASKDGDRYHQINSKTPCIPRVYRMRGIDSMALVVLNMWPVRYSDGILQPK